MQSQYDAEPVLRGFGPGGLVADPDSEGCLAMSAIDPALGGEKYYLKRATTGPTAGSLYDPNGPLARDPARPAGHLGKGAYEFRRCTKDAFDAYLSFLQTGNTLHLRHAERM